MTISVYIKHLEELNIDISYGDYIGYAETEDRMRYYTVVTNDGRVTIRFTHILLVGINHFIRTIICSYVSPNEFKGSIMAIT